MLKQIVLSLSTIGLLSLINLPVKAEPFIFNQRIESQKQTQTEYSDEELKALVDDFVRIIPDLQTVVIESNEEIATVISNQGLTQERFYQILRTPNSELEISAEEQQKFNTIKAEIVPIQQEALFKMYQVVNEEKKMTIGEMEAIVSQIQNDTELQEELRKMIIEVIVEDNTNEN